MRANKPYFIVTIDKKIQKSKREKLDSGVFLPPQFIYMKFNLQWGIIDSIGTYARKEFPEAEIGDTLLFKHIVEEQPYRLIATDDNFELRVVDVRSGTEVIGILKKDGTIIPNKNYIFFTKKKELIFFKFADHALADIDRSVYLDDEFFLRKIADLDNTKNSLMETAESCSDHKIFEDVYSQIERINSEQKKYSELLHIKKYSKLEVAHIHSQTCKDTGMIPGTQIFCDYKLLYELNLEYFDQYFYVTIANHIEGIIK